MKPDEAHVWTDEELKKLERRISNEYRRAYDELDKTIHDYFNHFAKRDAEQKARLDSGEITEQYYKQWRLNQMGRGERFKALQKKVAERMTHANEVAAAYVNGGMPRIYALNRNYTAYTIEKAVGSCDFMLWDESTVKRMIVENPDVIPYYPPDRAVDRGIDIAYGKQQISANVTSSVLQGKGIKDIADDLQSRITTMNRDSAIRAARTATTSAQNAGRQDSYEAAAKMGIKVRKRWIATKDNRTRHEHGMADGQVVEYDKPFDVGGYEMMFPGDKSAPGHLVYNCRCTMRTVEKDGIEAEPRQMRVRDPITGRNELASDMTYQEWCAMKERQHGKGDMELARKKVKNEASDKKQFAEYKAVLGKNAPDSFVKFQDLKYNNTDRWERLKTEKQQTVFVENAPCVTTSKKYTGYFLKPGAKHAQDFFNVGYTAYDSLRLRYDMARQFDMGKATNFSVNEKGEEKFRVYMQLGVTEKKIFRTAWQKDAPDSKPRILTAFREDVKDDK